MKIIKRIAAVFAVLFVIFFAACSKKEAPEKTEEKKTSESNITEVKTTAESGEIPEYNGNPYYVLNGNTPYFTKNEITAKSFETYGKLDSLSRCGVCMASIGRDLMPTEERGSIGQVKPSGWQTVKYDNVDGKYLYNRCHLIGFQLTGENANERNLITGTRYLNVMGMLPFEDMVADYIKETGNHVMYRVTPVFRDDELVARGVIMEGYSVEDNGEGILFCVYCYNVQPSIVIDYKTGESHAAEKKDSEEKGEIKEYILNTSSKKFHKPECDSAKSTLAKNKETYKGTREDLIKQGYAPCKSCNP